MKLIRKISFGFSFAIAFACIIMLLCIKDVTLSSMRYLFLIVGVLIVSGSIAYLIQRYDHHWITNSTKNEKLLIKKLPKFVRRRLVRCDCKLTDIDNYAGWYCAIYFIDKYGNENFIDGYGLKNFLSAVDDREELFH